MTPRAPAAPARPERRRSPRRGSPPPARAEGPASLLTFHAGADGSHYAEAWTDGVQVRAEVRPYGLCWSWSVAISALGVLASGGPVPSLALGKECAEAVAQGLARVCQRTPGLAIGHPALFSPPSVGR